MNKYEEENLNRILNEIKELEKKDPDISEEKKVYYLYHRLGETYKYKAEYQLWEENKIDEYNKKVAIYKEGTSEQGEAICSDINKTLEEGIKKLGMEAHLTEIGVTKDDPLKHIDLNFKTQNGKWYYANLSSDLMHIQTGMKVRNFGISSEQLKRKYKYDQNINKYIFNMNEKNEGKEFSKIEEEQLKQWDEEFKFTYKGLYTNDVIDMIRNETKDKKRIKEFFGTDKEDELVQKKFEFVMEKIGIANVQMQWKIGDVEAFEYYNKIINKILDENEKEKYFRQYDCFFEEEGDKRKPRYITIIEKQNENVYYLYNSNKQKYERIDKKELLERPIKAIIEVNKRSYPTIPISYIINSFEQRFEKERE